MHLQLNARCIIMMSIEEGNDGRRDFRMKAAPASRPHAHDKASKFVTCVEDGKQPQCLVIHSCSYERNQTFKLNSGKAR